MWSPNLFLSFNGICTILISPIPGITMKWHSGKLKSTVLAVSLCFRKAFHWPFCRDLVGFSPLLSSGFLPWISQSSPLSQSQRFFMFLYVHIHVFTHVNTHRDMYVYLSVYEISPMWTPSADFHHEIKILLCSVYFLPSCIISLIEKSMYVTKRPKAISRFFVLL